MTDRSAAVVGATGLVGRNLVDVLLEDESFARVVVLARRPFEHAAHPRLEARVIDFEHLAEEKLDVTDAFCALGTLMKIAGSKEAFRHVDFDYVLAFATAARRTGERIAVVSAHGADAKSSVFYNRVKGEMEAAVAALGFAASGFFRPSILEGTRAESRFAERIGGAVLHAVGVLPFTATRRIRPIAGRAVAEAMVAWSKRGTSGVEIVPSERIQEIADETHATR